MRNRNLLAEVEAFAAGNLTLAWILMLSLYVFRAFIPFLPSFAFYAMSGRIFPGRWIPLMVSLSGVILLYLLSYLIGFMKKRGRKNRLHLGFYRDIQENLFYRIECLFVNQHFFALLLLSLSPFPHKLLGRMCGRLHFNVVTFLTAALLGALPELISVTMLGKGILDLSSPLFYISLISTLAVALTSLFVYQRSDKKGR